MNKQEEITIKAKVTAKKVWAGIGLVTLGVVIALFIGYFFFIGTVI